MKLSFQYRGQKFDVYAIILDSGECPAIGFLEKLLRNDPDSQATLVRLYVRHADLGAIQNITKSRAIKGKKNLFEFKSKQGDRLLFFYMPGARTVLTHGFHKGDPEQAEYDRGERLRDQYVRECGNE